VYRRRDVLRIARVVNSDAGEYWCQAVNVRGSDVSTTCTVTVEPPGTLIAPKSSYLGYFCSVCVVRAVLGYFAYSFFTVWAINKGHERDMGKELREE